MGFDFCLTFSRCLTLLCQPGAFMWIPRAGLVLHVDQAIAWESVLWPYVLESPSKFSERVSLLGSRVSSFLILSLLAAGHWGPVTYSPDRFVAIWKWLCSAFLPFSAVVFNDSRLPLWSWSWRVENVRLQRIQAGGVFQGCVQTILHLLILLMVPTRARGIFNSSLGPFNSRQEPGFISYKKDQAFHAAHAAHSLGMWDFSWSDLSVILVKLHDLCCHSDINRKMCTWLVS